MYNVMGLPRLNQLCGFSRWTTMLFVSDRRSLTFGTHSSYSSRGLPLTLAALEALPPLPTTSSPCKQTRAYRRETAGGGWGGQRQGIGRRTAGGAGRVLELKHISSEDVL